MTETYTRVTTALEPVKECPYCGEEHFSRSLYGHVVFSSDDVHGERGKVPEGFSVEDAKTVDRRPMQSHVRDSSSEVVRCKFCGEDFSGRHGLRIHLAHSTPDADHPEDLNPDTAGIRVPRKVSSLPDEPVDPDEVAAAFHAKMDEYSGNAGKAGGMVPVEALEDLLDEFRMREPQGAAYVTCARMLEEVIEKHAEEEAVTPP